MLPQTPDSAPTHNQTRNQILSPAPVTSSVNNFVCSTRNVHTPINPQPSKLRGMRPPGLIFENKQGGSHANSDSTTTPTLTVWVTRNCGHTIKLLRKEVIQPHLPVRLPCYDFVPIADPTFDSSHDRPLASGVTNFHDVTGGVYKARERIHRSVADLRLLATPTSWGRVADPNPNYDRLSAIHFTSQCRHALYRPL